MDLPNFIAHSVLLSEREGTYDVDDFDHNVFQRSISLVSIYGSGRKCSLFLSV